MTRKRQTDAPAAVEPIRPGLAVESPSGRQLAERMNRSLARFEQDNGPPVAFAMVVLAEDGTLQPFWKAQGLLARHGTGWRSFLAMAGAMLTENALKDGD